MKIWKTDILLIPIDSYDLVNNVKKDFSSKIPILSPFMGTYISKKGSKLRKSGFSKKIIFQNGLECPFVPEKPNTLSKNDFRHYFEINSKFGGVWSFLEPK